MKRTRSKKDISLDPVEKRRDWLRFSGCARMHVWVSGGPIQDPHERVLQLLIQPWMGDYESWTVYRHRKDASKAGKIVFKKWNRDADRERFRALGSKEAPKDWNTKTNVAERHLSVPGRWVTALERMVGELGVPPIAGAVQPLSSATEYKLSLWRSRQESEFRWRPTPPRAWRPLASLFDSLLRNFRHHAEGKQLPPVDEL
jgi:hypothetical protein